MEARDCEKITLYLAFIGRLGRREEACDTVSLHCLARLSCSRRHRDVVGVQKFRHQRDFRWRRTDGCSLQVVFERYYMCLCIKPSNWNINETDSDREKHLIRENINVQPFSVLGLVEQERLLPLMHYSKKQQRRTALTSLTVCLNCANRGRFQSKQM
jgi:hypothetical protein